MRTSTSDGFTATQSYRTANGDLYYLARGAGGVVGRIATDWIFDDGFDPTVP